MFYIRAHLFLPSLQLIFALVLYNDPITYLFVMIAENTTLILELRVPYDSILI